MNSSQCAKEQMVSTASRFWRWLSSTPPYPKALAWCHSTDAFVLRRIIETGSLNPKHCEVFSEDLLYFFYGRPAYRYRAAETMHISARSPVVLILDPNLVLQGIRLYPFDTGAFHSRRYSNWMHPDMSMADFELACPSDAPQKHVSSFFGTNFNYLRLRARRPDQPFEGQFEVDSMLALLTDPSTEKADDRRTAVELQLSRPVPMKAPHVKALIVPEELPNADFLKRFLAHTGQGIEVQTYELTAMKSANEYQGLLESKAIAVQNSWGLQ